MSAPPAPFRPSRQACVERDPSPAPELQTWRRAWLARALAGVEVGLLDAMRSDSTAAVLTAEEACALAEVAIRLRGVRLAVEARGARVRAAARVA